MEISNLVFLIKITNSEILLQTNTYPFHMFPEELLLAVYPLEIVSTPISTSILIIRLSCTVGNDRNRA